MKNIFFKTFLILLPFFIYLTSGVILNSNHIYMFLLTNITYFFIGYISVKQNKSILFSLPFYLVLLLGLLLNDNLTSIIILYLVFIPISAYTGVYVQKKSILLLYFPLILVVSLYGINNWKNYYNNFDSRKANQFPEINLYDIKTDSLVRFAKNKTIVLDFWTTTCGICFKKFPEYERIYIKNKNVPSLEMYSVNIPVSIDTLTKTKKLVERLNYKFPTLYAKSSSIAKDSLGFSTYPHIIIIKDGLIRFNGSLITEGLVYNIENEIQRLLIKK